MWGLLEAEEKLIRLRWKYSRVVDLVEARKVQPKQPPAWLRRKLAIIKSNKTVRFEKCPVAKS